MKDTSKTIVRAVRVELIKPLSGETWQSAGSTLRTLSKVTPKLLNAAYDALVATNLVGTKAVKEVVAPETKGASPDALAYQAVNRAIERLREWGEKKQNNLLTLYC